MPDLDDNSLPTSSYGYSSTNPLDLESTRYTLVTFVMDTSGSVTDFRNEIEDCIQRVIKLSKSSPQADDLMFRLVIFDTTVTEIHGFKMLSQCNTNDYIGILRQGSMTALYDAMQNSIAASLDYAQQLKVQEYDSNAIVIGITDGYDNASKLTAKEVQKSVQDATKSESIDSILTILVGVNLDDTATKKKLQDFQKGAGIDQFEDVRQLEKLAVFFSKSISSQSKALGSQKASQPIALVI